MCVGSLKPSSAEGRGDSAPTRLSRPQMPHRPHCIGTNSMPAAPATGPVTVSCSHNQNQNKTAAILEPQHKAILHTTNQGDRVLE